MNSKCREKHEASQVPSPQKPRRIRAQHASHSLLEGLRNLPKKPKSTQSKPESSTPPLPSKIKQQFQQLQVALLARSLQSIDFQFKPENKDQLIDLQVALMHLNLQRKLHSADFAAQNTAVRNLIQLIAPQPPTQITQQVTVEKEFNLKKLDENGRLGLAEAIKQLGW